MGESILAGEPYDSTANTSPQPKESFINARESQNIKDCDNILRDKPYAPPSQNSSVIQNYSQDFEINARKRLLEKEDSSQQAAEPEESQQQTAPNQTLLTNQGETAHFQNQRDSNQLIIND